MAMAKQQPDPNTNPNPDDPNPSPGPSLTQHILLTKQHRAKAIGPALRLWLGLGQG